MNLFFFERNKPKGVVARRLYSGEKLKAALESGTGINFDAAYKTLENGVRVLDFDALSMMALEIMPKDEFQVYLEKAVKKQFASNRLWKFLYLKYKKDIIIPFITGHYTTKAVKGNLIVNTGHKKYADQVGGTTTVPVTGMAYGTGAVAAAATDTTLGAEVARGAATVTNTTTTTTGDTEQWVKTFTAPGTQAITEEGLFDNNTSGGIMHARNVFPAVNMSLNDTIQFTHKIQS